MLTLHTSAAVSPPLVKPHPLCYVDLSMHCAAVAVNAGANSGGGSAMFYGKEGVITFHVRRNLCEGVGGEVPWKQWDLALHRHPKGWPRKYLLAINSNTSMY